MRRIRVARVILGEMPVEAAEAHHARDVLRLGAGDAVEVFDDAGRTGRAVITGATRERLEMKVESVVEAATATLEWVVASAIPKGSRVDWMIEKLSELGASAFVPLAAERSVVLPEGKSKRQRWERLAAESAKQSRRSGVMRIEEMMTVAAFVSRREDGMGWFFSTAPGAVTVPRAVQRLEKGNRLEMMVGPEGGWTEDEIRLMEEKRWLGVSLGETVLRVETAAVAAGVIAASVAGPLLKG